MQSLLRVPGAGQPRGHSSTLADAMLRLHDGFESGNVDEVHVFDRADAEPVAWSAG